MGWSLARISLYVVGKQSKNDILKHEVYNGTNSYHEEKMVCCFCHVSACGGADRSIVKDDMFELSCYLEYVSTIPHLDVVMLYVVLLITFNCLVGILVLVMLLLRLLVGYHNPLCWSN